MGVVNYTVANGRVIAENRDGVRKRYVSDSQGSTVALLDNTQSKTDTFEYWPYGEEKSRTGTTPTPFRFGGTHGYYRDSASKTYVRARHLDTEKGRWLTRDPIGFWAGEVNLYRYVENNPVTFGDPTGLFKVGLPIGRLVCYGTEKAAQTAAAANPVSAIVVGTCVLFLWWLLNDPDNWGPPRPDPCPGCHAKGQCPPLTQQQYREIDRLGRIRDNPGFPKGRWYQNCASALAGCLAGRGYPRRFDKWESWCRNCYARCKAHGMGEWLKPGCRFWEPDFGMGDLF